MESNVAQSISRVQRDLPHKTVAGMIYAYASLLAGAIIALPILSIHNLNYHQAESNEGSLPTIVQPYDLNINGILEPNELRQFIKDYKFQPRTNNVSLKR